MIVQVLCGARYSPREKVFDAVIDKVEVKTLGELSPNEIQHDNPVLKHPDEMASFLAQLYNRDVTLDGHGHDHPLLRDQPQQERPLPLRLCESRPPRAPAGRSGSPQASQSTANTDEKRALQDGQCERSSPPHCGHAPGSSSSDSSKYRCAKPHERQTAAQSPRIFRRSSRSQSEALPNGFPRFDARHGPCGRSRVRPGESHVSARRERQKRRGHGGPWVHPC